MRYNEPEPPQCAPEISTALPSISEAPSADSDASALPCSAPIDRLRLVKDLLELHTEDADSQDDSASSFYSVPLRAGPCCSMAHDLLNGNSAREQLPQACSDPAESGKVCHDQPALRTTPRSCRKERAARGCSAGLSRRRSSMQHSKLVCSADIVCKTCMHVCTAMQLHDDGARGTCFARSLSLHVMPHDASMKRVC